MFCLEIDDMRKLEVKWASYVISLGLVFGFLWFSGVGGGSDNKQENGGHWLSSACSGLIVIQVVGQSSAVICGLTVRYSGSLFVYNQQSSSMACSLHSACFILVLKKCLQQHQALDPFSAEFIREQNRFSRISKGKNWPCVFHWI